MKTFTSEFCFGLHVIVEYWNPFNSVLDNSECFVQFSIWTHDAWNCMIISPSFLLCMCRCVTCVTFLTLHNAMLCYLSLQSSRRFARKTGCRFFVNSLKTPAKSTSDFKKDKIIIRSNNRMHAPIQCMCESSPVFRWARTVCNYDNHRHHN